MRVCKIGLGCWGSWGGCTLYRRVGALRPDNKGGCFRQPQPGVIDWSYPRTNGSHCGLWPGHAVAANPATDRKSPPLATSAFKYAYFKKRSGDDRRRDILGGGGRRSNHPSASSGIRNTELDDTCEGKRQPDRIYESWETILTRIFYSYPTVQVM